MVLYTCGQKKTGPALMHPCAKAAKALDAAGYEYEIKTVGGYRLMPWTWGSRGGDRAEVRKLSRLQHDRALGARTSRFALRTDPGRGST